MTSPSSPVVTPWSRLPLPSDDVLVGYADGNASYPTAIRRDAVRVLNVGNGTDYVPSVDEDNNLVITPTSVYTVSVGPPAGLGVVVARLATVEDRDAWIQANAADWLG